MNFPRAAARTIAHRSKARWQRSDSFSTALLLPDIHPWLKEYLAEENLVPITDEVVSALPQWEDIPFPTTSITAILAGGAIKHPTRRLPRLREQRAPANLPLPTPVASRTPAVALPSPRMTALPATRHNAGRLLIAAARRESVLAATERTMTKHANEQHGATAAHPTTNPPPTPRPVVALPIVRIPSPPAPLAPITPTPMPAGARRSTAPVPFTIPVDTQSNAAPSDHLLHLLRRAHTPLPLSPNLLAGVQRSLVPLQKRTRALVSMHRSHARRAARLPTSAPRGPTPWFHVPAPYNELLIVGCTVVPAAILWKTIGWPLWRAVRLPHPMTLTHRTYTAWHAMATYGARVLHALRAFRPALLQPATTISRPLPAQHAQSARPFRPLAHAGAFALVLLVVLLPLKMLQWGTVLPATISGRVLGASASILQDFKLGGAAITQSSFTDAVAAFDRAAASLDALPRAAGVLPHAAFAIGRHIPGIAAPLNRAEDARQAGRALAEASHAATRGMALLQAVDPIAHDAHALLRAAHASFATAHALAARAANHADALPPAIAAPIAQGANTLKRAASLVPIITALAGIDHPRRILLLFQNPAELRPTGGFIGAVALLDVANGTVRALEVPGGGSYDISGLSRVRVLPPEPLLLLNPTWQFHDANWFPDFPTSAKKLRWFYEESGGPSVDAVVAINAPFLQDVLALTGPVTIGSQTFRADDVLTLLTDTVEHRSARANGKPKAIIGSIAPVLLERLLALSSTGSVGERLALTDRLLRALDERDVLLAFNDDAVQRHVTAAHWDGVLRTAPHDALAVVHTNIGGGKSDAAIVETVTHEASVLGDGRAVVRVTIARTHTATPVAVGAPPAARLTAMQNVDYVRVYVPRGAKLLAATGFELPPANAFVPIPSDALPDRHLLATELNAHIEPTYAMRTTEEFGRTAFGGWILTPPGATRTVGVTYELPWTYAKQGERRLGRATDAPPAPYSLLIQKQPGTRATYRHRIVVDPTWDVSWHATNLAPHNGALELTDESRTDLMTGIMVSPR